MAEEKQKPKTSKAQQKATNKYIAKTYDRIALTVPKGYKARIQDFAAQHNESVNAMINRLLAEAMKKEGISYDWQPKTKKE